MTNADSNNMIDNLINVKTKKHINIQNAKKEQIGFETGLLSHQLPYL